MKSNKKWKVFNSLSHLIFPLPEFSKSDNWPFDILVHQSWLKPYWSERERRFGIAICIIASWNELNGIGAYIKLPEDSCLTSKQWGNTSISGPAQTKIKQAERDRVSKVDRAENNHNRTETGWPWETSWLKRMIYIWIRSNGKWSSNLRKLRI